MRRFMGWIAFASGAVAGGVWACGSSVNACDEGTKGCTDAAASPDASEDSPVVEATLPDAGDDAATEDEQDGGTGDQTDGSGSEDGAGDDATSDASTPETGSKCTVGASPAKNGCITDASGVFVATTAEGGSDTAGTGAMAHPFATITRALGNLGTSTAIYVCGGGYIDQVTVNIPINLYGGLTCSGGKWAYQARSLAVVSGSSASFALKIAVATGTVDIEDMGFDGATAAAGESSIAAWVNLSNNVILRRVKVVAGIGGAGADAGAPTPNYAGATAAPGAPAQMLASDAGAAEGGSATCAEGTSNGGQGAIRNVATSQQATGGTPLYAVGDPAANTGAGAPGADALPGTVGSDGENGGGAGGAPATTGTWSLSESVWIPSVAGNGTRGGPGQGGGGGAYRIAAEIVIAYGGAGGAGGCGGTGGFGGTSGGGSFGLLSVNSTVTLDECNVSGGLAGAGGNGSNGEAGQGPGAGGSVNGGAGGYGQGGGGGAGGSAGASAALAYVGTKPTYGSDTAITPFATAATPGKGGAAGACDPALVPPDPNLAANGAPGVATVPIAIMSLPTQ
jgi:hypothetical protein